MGVAAGVGVSLSRPSERQARLGAATLGRVLDAVLILLAVVALWAAFEFGPEPWPKVVLGLACALLVIGLFRVAF